MTIAVNKYFYHLDSLKFIAMILVFTSHCYFLKLSPLTDSIYNNYLVFSGLGVEFFIMVSGFFSAYTYKQQSVKDYLIKKSYRLFPMHWLCLIIGGYLLGIHCGKISILTPISVPLLQSLIPISGDTNPPSWTISTLFVLYAITPILINNIKKIKHSYYLPVAICLSILSTIINYFFYSPSNKILFWFLYVSPYYRIITYSIGIFIGLYVTSKERLDVKNNFIVTLIEALPIVTILALMFVFHKVPGFWYTLPVCVLICVFSLFLNGGGFLNCCP